MALLLIRLLGPSQVSLGGQPVSKLRSDKALALLTYLTVESDRAHRREKLAGMLWPDYPESSARANLRRALADLRQAIGDHEVTPPFLHATRQTIQFNTASDAWVDATALASELELARSLDPPNLQQIAEAEALYRGPFLEGFSIADSPEFEEWVVLTREQLFRLAMEALDCLSGGYEEQGKYEHALRYTWRQLELDPWRENVHRRAMRLLALLGRRDAALAQYETCYRLLSAELGAEPSVRTQSLYQQLLKEEWPPPLTTEAALSDLPVRTIGECPYRGLAAFGELDAPFFYGRQGFTALLQDAVQHRPCVVIVGPSGSGKSSAAFAGLVPLLRDGQDQDWLIAHCRPGGQPCHALAGALLPLLEPQLTETSRLIEINNLANAWQAGDLSLGQAVERVVDNHPSPKRLLLIIDQFEELYTLCPQPAQRLLFLDLLLPAAEPWTNAPESPAVLLLSLRADFMGLALAHRPLAIALQDGALMLGPMSREELRGAIKEPAEKQGAAFEAGLVDRILTDVGQEPGALPLLEFALTLLWEQTDTGWLTHDAYEALGRVEGALARYAEQVFDELDPAEQERVPRILIQLVQPGQGTEDTRRVAARSELGEENWTLTQHLADQRLVVTGLDSAGNETVEIAHEALIQNWTRLQDWLEADRAFRMWQEGLRASLRQWQISARDPGALLRGAPLAQAEEWLAKREGELSQPEKQFIDASISLRQQRAADQEAHQQRQLGTERRARRLLGLLAGVLAIATLGALVLTFFSMQQRRQALEAYSLSLVANAREALNDLDTASALALALTANQIDNPPHEAQRLLLEAAYAPGARWSAEVQSLFEGASGPVTALDINPDGRTALAGLAGGGIVLWDLDTNQPVTRLDGHTAQVNDVAFNPDGLTAISGGDDGQTILWDTGTGTERWRFSGHAGAVRAVDVSPDGRTAVSGGLAGPSWMLPGELILWDMETGSEIRRFEGHTAGIVAAEFAPDGETILASAGDAEIFADALTVESPQSGILPFDLILWDTETGESLRRFDALADDAYALSISPDGTSALTGSYYNNGSTLWDLETGEMLRTLEAHHEGVHAVAIGPGGGLALSGSGDDSLILWNLDTGEPVARFRGHDSDVLDLAFSPDGRTAISSSRDGRLIVWDLLDASEIQRLEGHGDMVWDVAFAPDDRWALSASGAAAPSVPVQDASLRLWNLDSAEQVREVELPVDVIFQIAISPDGGTALVATNEPFLRVWDLESWQETGRLEGHAGPVTGIEFVSGSSSALSVSVDGTLILWDVPSGQALLRLGGHGEGLWSTAISPDGRTALSDSGDSSMVLWNLETGEEIRSFVRQDAPGKVGSSGQAFLPNGRTAISCEQDGSLIEWDLETGKEIRRLGKHPSLRTRITISPDGRRALTSGMDGTLLLWDLESGELVRCSTGHGVIFDVALDHEGLTALFGSSDTTIVQWRLNRPSLGQLKEWVAANRHLPGDDSRAEFGSASTSSP